MGHSDEHWQMKARTVPSSRFSCVQLVSLEGKLLEFGTTKNVRNFLLNLKKNVGRKDMWKLRANIPNDARQQVPVEVEMKVSPGSVLQLYL